MRQIFYLLFVWTAISCGNASNQHGLKIPAEGLTFEMDEEDDYVIDGYSEDLTIELGKLNMGEGVVQIKGVASLYSSGTVSEAQPFVFTFDSVGYRLIMLKFNYNLISASTATFKIQSYEMQSESAVGEYHKSEEFKQAVHQKFDTGQSFEIMQRNSVSMELGKSIMYFGVGDITQGKTNVSVTLNSDILTSQNLSAHESFLFKIAGVDMILSCDKLVDDVLDQAFLSIRTATAADIQALNSANSMDGSSAVTSSSVIQNSEASIPKEGTTFKIYQRNTKVFTGKKQNLTIQIDDITEEQTAMTILAGDKELLLKSISQGQSVTFTFENKKYSVTCERLVNHKLGTDEGYFRIEPK